jgi:parallel beta-helix repeat protein
MKNKLIIRGLVLGIIILFIGTNVFPNINAEIKNYNSIDTNHFTNILNRKTLYVDDNSTYPGNGSIQWPYRYIWQGVENASVNDIVFVFNGSYDYMGNDVIVNKNNIFVIGDRMNETIITGNLIINGKGIHVENFTIGWTTGDGLYLEGCSNCNISNCNSNLLSINSSNINNVTNCQFDSGLKGVGAILYNSLGNFLIKNIFSGSAFAPNIGLELEKSDSNKIIDNYCWASRVPSIIGSTCLILDSSNGNTITNNFCMDSYIGIRITNSVRNTIHYNTITHNTFNGIIIESDSIENTISNNTIENNFNGIWLKNTYKNVIVHNNIEGTTNLSIYLSQSFEDNIHFNNIVSTKLLLLYSELSFSFATWNWWGGIVGNLDILGPLFRTFRFFFGIVLVRPSWPSPINNNCP